MTIRKSLTTIAAAAALLSTLSQAQAGGSPAGVWIDHTGRGGVEISDCGGKLCGRVVWVKDAADAKGCGMQIIGAAKPSGVNNWDHGWIYDPEDARRYSVALTPVNENTLKVVGYLGSKMFSETMIWKRAPASLQRCI